MLRFQRGNHPRSAGQYASHDSTGVARSRHLTSSLSWVASQVQVLLPESLDGGFGVVRTLVRDSTDAPQAAGAETFLDSDNTVSQVDAANRSTGSTLLVSGASFVSAQEL